MEKNAIVKHETTPASLIEIALQKDADISQLKELMDLQERWEKKEARKKFYEALATFQSKVPPLSKNKTASINSQKGAFKYKYADLGYITQQIKHLLLECGLSYRWAFQENLGQLKVTCYVSHSDGHTEETSMEAGADTSGYKNDIQQKGSTQTYLQRYTLIGALGLSTADDDSDGKGRQPENKERSEEEIMQQWSDTLAQVRQRTELNTLFLKNKKVVENNEEIRKLFKQREAELKAKETNGQQPKTQLP